MCAIKASETTVIILFVVKVSFCIRSLVAHLGNSYFTSVWQHLTSAAFIRYICYITVLGHRRHTHEAHVLPVTDSTPPSPHLDNCSQEFDKRMGIMTHHFEEVR